MTDDMISWQTDPDGDQWPSGRDLELWHEVFMLGYAQRLIYHSRKRNAADGASE